MLEKGNECVIIFVLQENFSAMTRLDQNRAAGQIAEKVNSLISKPAFYLSKKCLFQIWPLISLVILRAVVKKITVFLRSG